jgi:hypothetical protein
MGPVAPPALDRRAQAAAARACKKEARAAAAALAEAKKRKARAAKAAAKQAAEDKRAQREGEAALASRRLDCAPIIQRQVRRLLARRRVDRMWQLRAYQLEERVWRLQRAADARLQRVREGMAMGDRLIEAAGDGDVEAIHQILLVGRLEEEATEGATEGVKGGVKEGVGMEGDTEDVIEGDSGSSGVGVAGGSGGSGSSGGNGGDGGGSVSGNSTARHALRAQVQACLAEATDGGSSSSGSSSGSSGGRQQRRRWRERVAKVDPIREHEDATGSTALSEAACLGEVKAVRFLLARGSDPNTRNAQGRTPLWRSAYNSHADIVQMLLEAGALADTPDTTLQLPKDVANDTVKAVLEAWDNDRTAGLLANRSLARYVSQSQLSTGAPVCARLHIQNITLVSRCPRDNGCVLLFLFLFLFPGVTPTSTQPSRRGSRTAVVGVR